MIRRAPASILAALLLASRTAAQTLRWDRPNAYPESMYGEGKDILDRHRHER